MKLNLKENPTIIIIKEIFFEVINLFMGNVCNKIGLSVLFLILSMVCIFSPILSQYGEELNKPFIFYLTGFGLLSISIFLIGRRYKEIKNRIKSEQ